MAQADASTARIYLEATWEGASTYKRHGWETIEQISWNLADYGIDDAGDDGERKIKMLLMMREPAATAAADSSRRRGRR